MNRKERGKAEAGSSFRKDIVLVRKAVMADAGIIAQIHVDTWRSSYAGMISAAYLEALNVETQEKMWRKLLDPVTKPENNFSYIACQNGEIVGFLNGGLSEDGIAAYQGEIVALYVLEKHQGFGLGRQLMAAAVRRLQREKIVGLITWVLAENTKARNFYGLLQGEIAASRKLSIWNGEHELVGYGWRSLDLLTNSLQG